MHVGVIGLGIMGDALVRRLIGNGHDVVVHNRTREKAAPLLEIGAGWRDSPAAVATDSDVVLSLVTNSDAFEAISFGDDGILAGLGPETVHCDMSTIAPSAAVSIAGRYRDAGKRYVQAPVLGSKSQIVDGVLLILAGGDDGDIDKCSGVFEGLSRKVWQFATVEQSAATKLACNTLIAQMIVGLGQSIAIAGTAGVPPETVLDVLGNSALASPMYASKGKAIVDGNYAANFVVRNMLKDLRLASDYATEKSLPVPANAVNRELFVKAVAGGWGDEDYSAVVKTIIP